MARPFNGEIKQASRLAASLDSNPEGKLEI